MSMHCGYPWTMQEHRCNYSIWRDGSEKQMLHESVKRNPTREEFAQLSRTNVTTNLVGIAAGGVIQEGKDMVCTMLVADSVCHCCATTTAPVVVCCPMYGTWFNVKYIFFRVNLVRGLPNVKETSLQLDSAIADWLTYLWCCPLTRAQYQVGCKCT